MASTMARTSCSEALTSGRSGRTPGASDEVLMQFLGARIYPSTEAGERPRQSTNTPADRLTTARRAEAYRMNDGGWRAVPTHDRYRACSPDPGKRLCEVLQDGRERAGEPGQHVLTLERAVRRHDRCAAVLPIDPCDPSFGIDHPHRAGVRVEPVADFGQHLAGAIAG